MELHAEALQRIARSGENDWRRMLLTECVETYADLDENQWQRFQPLLATEPYREVRPLMQTTYERGKLDGQREAAVLQLEKRFGSLASAVKQRIEALSGEQLRQLVLDLVTTQSTEDLHLEG